MPEYIERETLRKDFIKLREEIKNDPRLDGYEMCFIASSVTVVKMIDDAPAADVAPVRHGRWVHRKNWDKWVCGKCSSEEPEPRNYCPHCGARMDEEE